MDGNFWEMKHCSGGELSTVFTQRWVAVVAFLKQRWGSEEEQQKVTWSKLIESSHVFLVFIFGDVIFHVLMGTKNWETGTLSDMFFSWDQPGRDIFIYIGH